MRTEKDKRGWITLKNKNKKTKNKNHWMRAGKLFKRSHISTPAWEELLLKTSTRMSHVFFFHYPYYNCTWVWRPRKPPESRIRGYGYRAQRVNMSGTIYLYLLIIPHQILHVLMPRRTALPQRRTRKEGVSESNCEIQGRKRVIPQQWSVTHGCLWTKK